MNSSSITLNDLSLILKSTSAKDRLNAIYYLYNSTEDWAYNLLIEAYDKERDAYIKTQIIEVVSNKNQDKSFELTVKALEDDNPEIRRTGWISLNENIISDKVKLQRVKEIFRKEKKADIKIFG
ncbi:MAG: HEAT repeat domain-containing protein, partial [Elusimicrobiales bacterium]